jgi:DMSO/TMAO reductase YedYZ molybdopterin-dependent catalytic subunit
MKPRLREGAFLGAILSAPFIAASYLGWKLAGLPFAPFDLFDWIARALPGSVVTFGIEAGVVVLRAIHAGNTSDAAKTAEQAMAVSAFVAAAAISGALMFGLLRLSDETALLPGGVLGVFLGGGALLIEQQLRRVESHAVADGAWILGTFLLWGLALGWAHDRLSDVRVTAVDSRYSVDHGMDRRDFLTRLAWAAGVPSFLAAVWALGTRGRRAAIGARWSDGHQLPNAGAVVTPVPGTRPEFTPLESHYRIDVDTRPPDIDAMNAANGDGWRLTIGGLVDTPLALTLDDLRREEAMHQFVTLSCISNPIGGDLIGTTRWSGVSVQRLLRKVQLKPAATHLKITSADGFFEVVALETVRNDPRVMLAYEWDGVPLLMEHGFPLRIYIPDVYGMKQPKWIERIDAADRWEPGYWVARGWDREGRMQATSVVDTVHTSASGASAGGIAHAGARGISKVEARVDEGAWRNASLREPLSETTWTIWRADLQSEAGDHVVTVRSYAGDGTPQAGTLHTRRASAKP